MANKRPSTAKQPAVKPMAKPLSRAGARAPKLNCPGDCDKLTVDLKSKPLAGSWLIYHGGGKATL